MGHGHGLRFFFVLTSLARIVFTVGIIERPLVVALVAGWLTGRWDVALPLAIFLELFWLDIIRLGTIAPPSGSISFFLLLPTVLLLDIEAPRQLPLPLMLCVPCAYAVSRLERALRGKANEDIGPVTRWCAGAGGTSPQRVVWRSVTRQIVGNGLLFILCFYPIYGLLALMQHHVGLPEAPGLSWNVLYGVGLMGAVLALRTRRAYAVLGCALTAMLVIHL